MLTKAIDIHLAKHQLPDDPILHVIIQRLIIYKLCALITLVRFFLKRFVYTRTCLYNNNSRLI